MYNIITLHIFCSTLVSSFLKSFTLQHLQVLLALFLLYMYISVKTNFLPIWAHSYALGTSLNLRSTFHTSITTGMKTKKTPGFLHYGILQMWTMSPRQERCYCCYNFTNSFEFPARLYIISVTCGLVVPSFNDKNLQQTEFQFLDFLF